MAAVAGSTVTALGAAQRYALRGQMSRLSSHTSDLSLIAGDAGMPVHAWVEGAGSFNSLHNSGDMSGYRLNAWGASAGASVSPQKDVLVGVALSAMYGDLDAHGADSARGDLDSFYLSLYGHVQSSAWGHSLIVSAGTSEAKLNRTVDYGLGSYSTHGKTDGVGVGAVYELTYDLPLNEDRSSLLQPLFSASIVSTSMDAYSESGAGNIGLNVGEQKWITGSIATGARWVGKMGSRLFGRAARAEVSMAIAQDLGDSQGQADVALLADPTMRRRVKGAKIGSTAAQLGAGLALPVEKSMFIYTNAHADFRHGAHSWNASAGVQMSF